jgi:chorismate mutase-like protein
MPLDKERDHAMTSPDASLQSLRRQIDHIDDQLHDLIMARSALVERIAAAKSETGMALRPGREAEILRRLTARHSGPFPKAALVRIWRELIGAVAGLQAPLSIAVAGDSMVELARNHFGVVWPVTASASAGQVVKLVDEGKATVGVLPLPAGMARDAAVSAEQPAGSPGATEPWWAALTGEREDMPRVVTRLPVYPFESESLEALIIARRPHDNTGQDRTLVVVEAGTQVSRDRVRALLTAAGFEPLAALGGQTVGGHSLHLVEVDGWFTSADPRMGQLVREPVLHASVIGGYPVPLAP